MIVSGYCVLKIFTINKYRNMKFLLIILGIFLSISSFAQKKNLIGFGCGYSGMASSSVFEMDSLVLTSDYNSIRKNLSSLNSSKKCLSVIVCEILYDKGLIELTTKELKAIKNSYNSSKRISVCSGCTYFEETTMKDILDEISHDGWIFNVRKIAKERYLVLLDKSTNR